MTTPTPRWTADLRVAYDRPETVAEMLDWLVDSDPIELRDVALNLLHDVETLKVVLTTLADAGVLTAMGGETRQDIEVQTGGLRYPCNDLPRAWRQFGELKAKGYDAQIVQRDVWVGPWRVVTDGPA